MKTFENIFAIATLILSIVAVIIAMIANKQITETYNEISKNIHENSSTSR